MQLKYCLVYIEYDSKNSSCWYVLHNVLSRSVGESVLGIQYCVRLEKLFEMCSSRTFY